MEDDEIKERAKAIEGLVKAIPIYQDLLQPAAKELGRGLETVAKTVNIALAPLKGLVWGYEQIRTYLVQNLSKKLEKTEPENIQTPDPAIAGPAIEALRFSGCHEEIRNMFVNLLATSIDRETASSAHPAFVSIIQQIVPDEGKILKQISLSLNYLIADIQTEYLPGGPFGPFRPLDSNLSSDGSKRVLLLHNISDLKDSVELDYPEMFGSYIDNLHRLNLIKITEWKEENPYWNWKFDRLLNRVEVRKIIKDGEENVAYNLGKAGIAFRGVLTLSSFGFWFKKAVVND